MKPPANPAPSAPNGSAAGVEASEENRLTPMLSIRRRLGLTQAAFGAIACVNQATVSRWDNDLLKPDYFAMQAIRNHARQQRIAWDDSWFFDLPKRNGHAK